MGDNSSSSEENNVSRSKDVCSAFLGLGDFTILTASQGEVEGTDGFLFLKARNSLDKRRPSCPSSSLVGFGRSFSLKVDDTNEMARLTMEFRA
eukprot:scaffold15408_cov41-Cyclotella_meneghiniana.AAC.8